MGRGATMNLTADMVREIDCILAAAQEQGRGRLYEHEVYGILQTIGLGVPRHRFVRDIAEVTPEALVGFGRSIMTKIVSPGVPHKQRLGGVKRVATADPLYVQFVLTKMREEMLSHFPAGEGPEMAGFLRGSARSLAQDGARDVPRSRRPGRPAPGSRSQAPQADGRLRQRRQVLRGFRLRPGGRWAARVRRHPVGDLVSGHLCVIPPEKERARLRWQAGWRRNAVGSGQVAVGGKQGESESRRTGVGGAET